MGKGMSRHPGSTCVRVPGRRGHLESVPNVELPDYDLHGEQRRGMLVADWNAGLAPSQGAQRPSAYNEGCLDLGACASSEGYRCGGPRQALASDIAALFRPAMAPSAPPDYMRRPDKANSSSR